MALHKPFNQKAQQKDNSTEATGTRTNYLYVEWLIGRDLDQTHSKHCTPYNDA